MFKHVSIGMLCLLMLSSAAFGEDIHEAMDEGQTAINEYTAADANATKVGKTTNPTQKAAEDKLHDAKRARDQVHEDPNATDQQKEAADAAVEEAENDADLHDDNTPGSGSDYREALDKKREAENKLRKAKEKLEKWRNKLNPRIAIRDVVERSGRMLNQMRKLLTQANNNGNKNNNDERVQSTSLADQIRDLRNRHAATQDTFVSYAQPVIIAQTSPLATTIPAVALASQHCSCDCHQNHAPGSTVTMQSSPIAMQSPAPVQPTTPMQPVETTPTGSTVISGPTLSTANLPTPVAQPTSSVSTGAIALQGPQFNRQQPVLTVPGVQTGSINQTTQGPGIGGVKVAQPTVTLQQPTVVKTVPTYTPSPAANAIPAAAAVAATQSAAQ